MITEATRFIADYGYWGIAGVVGLESMGIPLPGETILIAAAAWAAFSHQLSIELVIAAAAGGAIVGDSLGYLIGRRIGFPLLLRYGARIGATEARLKVGQYLFLRHGGKVVFHRFWGWGLHVRKRAPPHYGASRHWLCAPRRRRRAHRVCAGAAP